MSVNMLIWKLASPYDAYVSHVARLNHAIEQIRYLSDRALGYEAGLRSSVRFVAAESDREGRRQRLRDQLATAAASMSDEEFEAFIIDLGGGDAAEVETNRAKAASRLGHMTRGIGEYFAMAGRELATLERRGYNPGRGDIARQLKANRLPGTTLAEYRHELHVLGTRVGQKAG